jgi:hypothetical protein
MGLCNALAYLGVDFDVTLKQLWLDRVFEVRGQLFENLSNAATQRHGLAATRLSSISTPTVGLSFTANL